VYGDSNTTTTVWVNGAFADDVGPGDQDGYGLMRSAVVVNGISYPYLGWTQGHNFFLDTVARGDTGAAIQEGVSVAKFNDIAKSALDGSSSIHLVCLKQRITQQDASFSWIADRLDEDRQIDDTGNPLHTAEVLKPRWIDVHVQFIPKPDRALAYRNMLMREIMDRIPTFSDLKVTWSP
jgi:hypothetical protein